MNEDQLKDAALLVFANKQDLPKAMSLDEVTREMNLSELRKRDWYVQACCAQNGEGLY